MADYQLNQIQSDIDTLRQAGNRIASVGDSAAATAQTVTIAAPGAGARLHLTALIVSFSDSGNNELTVGITQGGTAKTLKINTGSQLLLTGLDLAADENTAITVDAPAGAAGVTSHIAAESWTETL